MSILDEKRRAAKAMRELKRTDPEAYEQKVAAKFVKAEKPQRFLVQWRLPNTTEDAWQTLFSTNNQGYAIEYVIQASWSGEYEYVNWLVYDTEWVANGRTHSSKRYGHNLNAGELLKIDKYKSYPPDGRIVRIPSQPNLDDDAKGDE